MRSTVAIARCLTYNLDDVRGAVRTAVDLLGGIGKYVRPGSTALVKPNLLSPRAPETAICTHPTVTQAVAELIVAAGASCSVGDGPCVLGESESAYERVLDATGTRRAAEAAGASVVRFDDGAVDREIPDALVYRRIPVTTALDGIDALIDVPKMKTHQLTRFTGAVKNLYGCLPARRKLEFHFQAGENPELFSQILVDLLRAVRPALSIMDGVIGMDGRGPSNGRKREFGVIIASGDPVAADATACMVMGLDPMAIPMLRLADEQGVGIADPSRIDLLGVPIEEVRLSDVELPPFGHMLSHVPRPLYRAFRNQLTLNPSMLASRCVGCRQCMKACPASAISGEGTRLKIDYTACIRCFCCQEVCPHDAIRARPGVLRRLLSTFSRDI